MNRYLITYETSVNKSTFEVDCLNPIIELKDIVSACVQSGKKFGIDIVNKEVIILLFCKLN